MQKQSNELKILIAEAFRRGNPVYLAPVLSIIYNKVNIQSSFVQKDDIEKLNKLSYKSDSASTYYIVGLTYDLIFSSKLIEIPVMKSEILLNMANSLLPVLENIKGTTLSYRIAQYIQSLLYIILERKDISKEEAALIHSLLEGENLKIRQVLDHLDNNEDFKEIMKLSKSKSEDEKISSAIKLMELLTSCSSFQEQVEFFAQKTLPALRFILSGTNETYMDLFEVLGVFLEMILYQFQYNVRFEKKSFDSDASIEKNPTSFIYLAVDRSDKQFNTNGTLQTINKEFSPKNTAKIVAPFILAEEVKKIRESQGIFTVAIFLLNIFILYPKYIKLQLLSIRVLERLYYHFPANRKNMEELIMILFSYFNSETSEELRKPAAIFLYRLMHRDASPSFKAELENCGSLQNLFSSMHYDSAALIAESNEAEITDVQDLHIMAGTPLDKIVEAGNITSEYIEVWQPYSLLTFSLSILQHDVSFSIERVARFKQILKYEKDKPYKILKGGKIDASKNPINGSILIREPGLYRIEFDNKNSWFNSKTVHHRIFVLSPNFEDSFELKTKKGLLFEATLGQMALPSTIFASNDQSTLNVSKARVNHNSSMMIPQKDGHDIRTLVYLNPKSIEFSIISTDKEFDLVLNHDTAGQIDWERINSRISDLIKKVFDSNSDQEDKKVDMSVVYDEAVMEKLLGLGRFDTKFHDLVEDYFFDHFSLLNKIKKLMKDASCRMQIITELEFQAQRILNNVSAFTSKTLVLFVIDHATKGMYCKLRKETGEISDINIEEFVVPVSGVSKQTGEEVVELKPADILFFHQNQSNSKRLGYLAFLIRIVFRFSNRLIHDYVILEDTPIFFDAKSKNRTSLKEILNSVHNDFKKAGSQANSGNLQENSIIIHFCDQNKDSNIKL